MTRRVPPAEFVGGDIAVDNCWKRIGIRGDKSCPELAQHVHCRDCPTFSHIAAALLDREPPEATPGVQAVRSKTARPSAEVETESATIFRIGAEWFALPTMVLDEIVTARPIHSLPHKRNPALLGLVNVRGELVICVSIAPILTGASQGAADGRLIIVRHPEGRLACPVDEVQRTCRYSPRQLEAVPATVGRSASSLTRGLRSWKGRTVAHIDEQALFEALSRSLSR